MRSPQSQAPAPPKPTEGGILGGAPKHVGPAHCPDFPDCSQSEGQGRATGFFPPGGLYRGSASLCTEGVRIRTVLRAAKDGSSRSTVSGEEASLFNVRCYSYLAAPGLSPTASRTPAHTQAHALDHSPGWPLGLSHCSLWHLACWRYVAEPGVAARPVQGGSAGPVALPLLQTP